MKSTTNYENLAVELIVFLKKWGLWQDMAIFTNGEMFATSSNREDSYNGITHVLYKENVDPTEYTRDFVDRDYCDATRSQWVEFANPEHIFDVVYEGPLYDLLNYEEYIVRCKDVEKEAWDYIFANTSVLVDIMYDRYGMAYAEDYFEAVQALRFGETGREEIENCQQPLWDPLVFDTWEEYLEMGGDEESSPLHEFYDAYSEYLGDAENFGMIDINAVECAWEEMVAEAKREFIDDIDDKEKLCIPEISGYLREEFMALFDKYNLWFDFGFKWSLSCYRK